MWQADSMGCSSSSVSKTGPAIRDESIDDFYYLDDDDVLGKGRNDPVVRCVRLSDKREFAAKTVPRDAQSLREVELMQTLNHPNVLKCVDCFARSSAERMLTTRESGASGAPSGPRLMLVLELARGGDLFELVRGAPGGKLAEAEAARHCARLLAGVAYLARAGVVHRDLKLENVMLTSRHHHRDGTVSAPELKIADLGLAAHVEELEPGKLAAGTPQYMAPEVLDNVACTSASDVWACGCCLHAMLTGSLPCDHADYLPSQICDFYRRNCGGEHTELGLAWEYPPLRQLSHGARDALRAMLRVDAAHRPSATELLGYPWIAAAAGGVSESRQPEKASTGARACD